MRAIHILLRRAKAIFRRESLEREMEAEMAEHLASEIEALVERGLAREEARKQAQKSFGYLDLVYERCRDARGVNWWEQLLQDTSFAMRLLVKNRMHTALVIATMALGIGSTSAVFAIVDAILLRPLAYPEPHRLISVEGIGMKGPFDTMRSASAVADYAAHQGVRSFNLVAGGRSVPERVKGSEVSANFFGVLGIGPAFGRTFQPDEDRPGRTRVAVLSHSFWVHRLSGRGDAIGRQILLDETPYTVVGIMPASFAFPSPEAQIWTPMTLDPRSAGDHWGMGGTYMIARLRDGATIDSAVAELRAQIPRIRRMFPWRMPDAWGTGLEIRELRDFLVSGARRRTWLLLAAVSLVLLISVVNVANLMAGSTAARSGEIGLRVSLGATQRRLGRQLLTEAFVLTSAGGVAGVLLGYAQIPVLLWLLPSNTPRLSEVAMDTRILAFAAAVTIASGLLVGLWPVWRVNTRRERAPAGSVLVVAEAAIATVLLVGSGLLLRSLWSMLEVNPGFEVGSVVTAELTPSPSARRVGLWDEVRARLLEYPGVREVAAMNVLPLTPEVTAFAATIEDHPLPPQDPQYVLWSTAVTPEHTSVLGVKLLAGRTFTTTDHARSDPVLMISKSTAQRFWSDRNPIGRRVKPVSDRQWRRIVGVVEDVKTFGIAGPPSWVNGEVYVPMAQAGWTARPVSLVVRMHGDREGFEKALPSLVHEVCTTCAVSKIARMADVVARAVETPRSTAWLLAGFTLLALVIAAAGIYGVVNHAVVRRTRELGVRLALGAGNLRMVALVIRSTLGPVAVGCAAGLVAAWALVRLIQNLLFGITPHDPLSFAAAPVLLLGVALLAGAVPAARALHIDPARCLREG